MRDKDGRVLCQSGVGKQIWALYETDKEAFQREVLAYFAIAFPGWKVVRADYKNRIIWIRDDRRKGIV